MAMSYADKARAAQQGKAKEALSNKGDPREWVPDFGTHRIRLLPPRDFKSDDPRSVDFDQQFYYSHSYHFVHENFQELANNSGKGKYLYTRKKYVAPDGKTVNDPFDDLTRTWYAEGRRTGDKTMNDLAGAIKRKRRYVAPVILLDEKDPEKKFRFLVDPSNDGKLIKKLCLLQGLPFYRDIDDKWVDEETTKTLKGKKYCDLLDPEQGYDLVLVKTKTGPKNWDISFNESFPDEETGPRALDENELAMLEQRIDIRTYIPYEEDYANVKAALDALTADCGGSASAADAQASKPAAKAPSTKGPAPEAKIARQASVEPEAADEDAAGVEDILSQLEADNGDSKDGK